MSQNYEPTKNASSSAAFKRTKMNLFRAFPPMEHSNTEVIDFCLFPFEQRFSENNAIYYEIWETNRELNKVLRESNVELHEKLEIRNILKENFAYVGHIMRSISQYLNTPLMIADQRTNVLRTIVAQKLLCYLQDEQESLYFSRVKDTTVEIRNIDPSWKCHSWPKQSPKANRLSTNNPSETDNTLVKSSVQSNVESEEIFGKDYEEIVRSLALVENRVRTMTNKINLLDEHIICLYSNFKEYLKIFLKFDKQFSDERFSDDPNIRTIKCDILKVFAIESKIDFFSQSPFAYVLNTPRETLSLELRKTEQEDVELQPSVPLNSDVTIQDTANNFPTLSYVNDPIYIDSSGMQYSVLEPSELNAEMLHMP